jgi:hypothetical protein
MKEASSHPTKSFKYLQQLTIHMASSSNSSNHRNQPLELKAMGKPFVLPLRFSVI